MYSLNSSSGASKSGAIQWIVPLALPALHGHCCLRLGAGQLRHGLVVLGDHHLVARGKAVDQVRRAGLVLLES